MDDFHDQPKNYKYWKLNNGERMTGDDLRYELYWSKFRVLKTAKVPHLRSLYMRSQRGKPSYEGVSLSELKRYANKRGLSTSASTTSLNKVEDKTRAGRRRERHLP
jgi:hypothetical protein